MSQRASRRTILIVCVAVALLVAGGTFSFRRWRAAHQPKPAPIVAATPQPAEITLPGLTEAHTIVSVGPAMEGTLDSYFVEVNQEVYQGQLLGRIRNPKLDETLQHAQADLDKAQARVVAIGGEQLAARLEASRAQADQTRAHNEVARLQKDYDRQQGLWAAGATARLVWEKAQKEFLDAKADVEKQDAAAQQASQHEAALARDLESAHRAVTDATAAIEHAKVSAAESEMHSPVDGIVVARQELQGQPVDPSMKELLKIGTDLTSLSVTIQNEAAAARVHSGQAVTVRIGNDEFAGTVRSTDGHVLIIDFNVSTAATQLGQAAQVIIKF